MKGKHIILFLLVFGIPFVAPPMLWPISGDVIEVVGSGEIHWSQGILLAKGSGAPPKEARNIAQARLMAERAALVDARRNLLEVLKGVWVDSNTLVENTMVKNDEIRLQAEGFIQGAVELRNLRSYLSDGGIEVTVAMSLKGDFLAWMLNLPGERIVAKPPAVSKPFPQAPSGPPERKEDPPPQPLSGPGTDEKPKGEEKPPPVPAKPAAEENPVVEAKPAAKAEELPPYTGLVIDTRGLNMRPALLPKVYDEGGKELYQGQYVSSEKAAQTGIALYSRDLTAAQTNPRVGKNPLTVKGVKLKDGSPSEIILRGEDAQKVNPFARAGTFLEECRVMIVLD
jgi:hypothetical protein